MFVKAFGYNCKTYFKNYIFGHIFLFKNLIDHYIRNFNIFKFYLIMLFFPNKNNSQTKNFLKSKNHLLNPFKVDILK